MKGRASSMFCPACGAASDDRARFCATCGRALPVLEPEPSADPAGISSQESPPPSSVEVPPVASNDAASTPPLGSAPSPFEPYPTTPPPSFSTPPGYGVPTWAPTSKGPLASFGAPLASWWQRVGSMLLDGLILFVPWLILSSISSSLFGTNTTVRIGNTHEAVRSSGVAGLVLLLFYIVVQALYFACFNGQGTGQTVGNRAPGIAVRDAETGEPIGIGRGLVRWLVRIALYGALFLPGLLNDLFPLWDKRRQTIADKAARSVVIRLK